MKKDKLDLTQEELSRFEKAFKDPEFRKLFAEYAKEISENPKAKEQFDLEISKLEKNLFSEVNEKVEKYNESRKEKVASTNSETRIEEVKTPKTPKYDIVHRNIFSMQNHVEGEKQANIEPDQLVINIQLPLLDSIAGVDLEICGTQLTLSDSRDIYKLEVNLPFQVNDDTATAQFDKATKQLIVTADVIKTKIELPKPIVTESISSQAEPAATQVDEEKEIDVFQNEVTVTIKSKEHSFTFKQNLKTMVVAIPVENIVADSVQVIIDDSFFMVSYKDHTNELHEFYVAFQCTVDSEQSSYKLTEGTLVLNLMKEEPNLWTSLQTSAEVSLIHLLNNRLGPSKNKSLIKIPFVNKLIYQLD